jgi:hypothetical protein
MLRWARLRLRPLAAATMVALAAAVSATTFHHARECHDECMPAVVVHDASAHRITGIDTTPESAPLHCLVCHLARSFRPRVEPGFHSAPVAAAGGRMPAESFAATRPALAAQPPLRSPPLHV